MTSPIEHDPAILSPLLADLGLPPATAADLLLGGGVSHWRLTLADGTRLVLRHLPETPIASEVYVSNLLAGLDLPTRRVLHTDDSRTLLPFAFALTNYIEGEPVRAFFGAPDRPDLFRQMGALLRQLHRIELPGFGHLGAEGPTGPARFDDFLDQHMPSVFKGFRERVFAHNDFQPGNLLAARDADGHLRLTGLIDYGSAVGNDPTSDLAKAMFICEHESPGSSAFLREGYGPLDHPEPAEALRLNLLLHRVIMWAWLRRSMPAEAPGLPQLLDDLRAMLA
jgi:aminoglycoside phosphotransferase (APT) family kinase protein